MDFFVIFAFLGLAIFFICKDIYNHTSHSKTNGKILQENASIFDIKTQNVGGKRAIDAAIRTTVFFDDGFIYISHKSHMFSKGIFGKGTIEVDEMIIDEILKDAIAAHQKAYRKQFYKR